MLRFLFIPFFEVPFLRSWMGDYILDHNPLNVQAERWPALGEGGGGNADSAVAILYCQ